MTSVRVVLKEPKALEAGLLIKACTQDGENVHMEFEGKLVKQSTPTSSGQVTCYINITKECAKSIAKLEHDVLEHSQKANMKIDDYSHAIALNGLSSYILKARVMLPSATTNLQLDSIYNFNLRFIGLRVSNKGSYMLWKFISDPLAVSPAVSSIQEEDDDIEYECEDVVPFDDDVEELRTSVEMQCREYVDRIAPIVKTIESYLSTIQTASLKDLDNIQSFLNDNQAH